MINEKQLSVRLNGTPVGILEQNSVGHMSYSYNSSTTQAISAGMPIREEPYPHIQCEAFFGGLLPESETTRKIIGKKYGISPNNSFAILKAIGYDCAGAISFHSITDTVIPNNTIPLDGIIVSDNTLYQHIKALPQTPLFLGFEGLRLSLAGVQDKAAVCIIDNKIALPQHGCPTTYILKPAIHGFPGIVENEYFCLKIAKQIGLTVPHVEIKKIKDITYLLIERYDRKITDNKVERIHQEDFCQALGIISRNKYQHDGGPSLVDCFSLLQKTTQPAINRMMLAEGMVFNFLVCNMDAHGKNFSLLHTTSSNLELSPFYDILCTQVYPNLSSKMAMKIGNQYQADEVFARHWQKLCNDINYSYPAIKQLIYKQAQLIMTIAEKEKRLLIEQGWDNEILSQIIDRIERHVTKTIKRFEHE